MAKAVSAIIATVLLLMMTVAAAAGAYYWYQSVQEDITAGAEEQLQKFVSLGETKMSIMTVQANEVTLRNIGTGVIGSVDLVIDNKLVDTIELNLQPGKTATIDLGTVLRLGKTYNINIIADNGAETKKTLSLRTAVLTKFKDSSSISLSASDSNSILVQKNVDVRTAEFSIYPEGIETGSESDLMVGNGLKTKEFSAPFTNKFDSNAASRAQFLFSKNELYAVDKIKQICFQKGFQDSGTDFYIDSNTVLDSNELTGETKTSCTITDKQSFDDCVNIEPDFATKKQLLYSAGTYGTMEPFTIKMCQTDSASLSGDFDSNCIHNEILVYSKQYQIIQGNMFDWVCFGLDTNYEYDSSENFVVEMSWTGSTPVFPADLDTNYKQWLEDSSVQLCSIIVQQDPSFECSTNVVVSTFIENILTKSLPFFYTAKDGNVLVSQCCYSDSQFKVPSALQPNIKMTVAPVSYLDNFNLNLGASSIYSRTEILTPLQAPVKVDFKTALQNFLNTCTADSNGFCEVPLSIINSGSEGKLRLGNLKIELTA